MAPLSRPLGFPIGIDSGSVDNDPNPGGPTEVAPGSGGIEVTLLFRPRNNGRKSKDAPSSKTRNVEPGNVPRVSGPMALAIKFGGAGLRRPHPAGLRDPALYHPDHEPSQPGARHPGGDPVPAQDREGPRPDPRAGRPTHRRCPYIGTASARCGRRSYRNGCQTGRSRLVPGPRSPGKIALFSRCLSSRNKLSLRNISGSLVFHLT